MQIDQCMVLRNMLSVNRISFNGQWNIPMTSELQTSVHCLTSRNVPIYKYLPCTMFPRVNKKTHTHSIPQNCNLRVIVSLRTILMF